MTSDLATTIIDLTDDSTLANSEEVVDDKYLSRSQSENRNISLQLDIYDLLPLKDQHLATKLKNGTYGAAGSPTADRNLVEELGRSQPRVRRAQYKDFTHHLILKAVSGSAALSIEDEFSIVYTSSNESLRSYIANLPRSCALGFDTEGDGVVTQICCLQNTSILIFCMPLQASLIYRSQCADTLSSIIGSKDYIKVGIAAVDDAMKLHLNYGVQVENIFDLNTLGSDLSYTETGEITRTYAEDRSRGVIVIDDSRTSELPRGLKKLFWGFFSSHFDPIIVDKSYSIMSNNSDRTRSQIIATPGKPYNQWTEYPLSEMRLEYAAKDAIFGSFLYNKMISKFSSNEISKLQHNAAVELQTRKARRQKRFLETLQDPKKTKKVKRQKTWRERNSDAHTMPNGRAAAVRVTGDYKTFDRGHKQTHGKQNSALGRTIHSRCSCQKQKTPKKRKKGRSNVS